MKTITADTIGELRRCLGRFTDHEKVLRSKGNVYGCGLTRAAARRSSLDLTRALAAWRKAGTSADVER